MSSAIFAKNDKFTKRTISLKTDTSISKQDFTIGQKVMMIFHISGYCLAESSKNDALSTIIGIISFLSPKFTFFQFCPIKFDPKSTLLQFYSHI